MFDVSHPVGDTGLDKNNSTLVLMGHTGAATLQDELSAEDYSSRSC